ncbi:MAG: alpha-glucosidase family protein [Pseudomonadota bacterium]
MNVLHDTRAQDVPGVVTAHAPDKDWWRGAVIYQIYPRSFQDSNDDGIGDLRGITMRLPYIAGLGVDAIWISPFFTSPMEDFGYDVSDYCDVDPMFGSIADFDAMIAEAHRLGLKVMIDQVISHTSDQHDWFKESRSSQDSEKADWYVWADAKPDGSPPNNWLSIFGGSAWEWCTGRCQYYLHNFLTSQPDLNFHNRDVQDALLDTVRFWLDRGVDGFRLDTINFYFHSDCLTDNPPLEPEKRNDKIAPKVNPYNYQSHQYDKNQPENLDFLKRFRALLEEYPAAAAVGEVGDAENGLQIVSDYTSGDDMIHMCYAFDFLAPDPLSAAKVREVVQNFEEVAPDGWACWAFSNHDVVRHASRWADHIEDRDAYLKMTAALILALRGSVCLYQGEELGLTEAQLAFEDLQDPYGKRFWPTFKGRDGCRTPMVWSHNDPKGGFTSGDPWLPVAPEHLHLAANAQLGEDDSLLAHYMELLDFRAQHQAFSKGDIRFVGEDENLLAFTRTHRGTTVFVAINMSEKSASMTLPDGSLHTLDGPGSGATIEDHKLTLPPFGAYYATTEQRADGGETA